MPNLEDFDDDVAEALNRSGVNADLGHLLVWQAIQQSKKSLLPTHIPHDVEPNQVINIPRHGVIADGISIKYLPTKSDVEQLDELEQNHEND